MAATFDPTFLFDKPTFCGTYFHAFKICFAHWQTFMGLGLLLILVTAVIWIVFRVISISAFEIDPLAILQPITDTIRIYGRIYTTNDDVIDFNYFWITVSLFFLAMMVLCLAATATFTGSLIRATAEAYAGASPEFRSSLRYGWNAKWRIFCFSFLLFLGLFISYLVIVVLPLFLTRNLIALVLLAIVYVVIYVVMVSLMIGAMPSIVLENVSATGAFKRSWNLCKSSTCEIFCKLIVFSFGMEVIPWIIMQIIVSLSSSIFSFIISGFLVVMTIVLSVVIYMGMRIVKEELTQVSFNQQLALPAPDNQVNEVEASNEPTEYSV